LVAKDGSERKMKRKEREIYLSDWSKEEKEKKLLSKIINKR